MRFSRACVHKKTARFLFVFFLAAATNSFPQENILRLATEQQMVKAGRAVFERHCIGCHGTSAEGNGPAAAMLSPKPRNLVSGAFKFRTTPLGTLPTLNDLVRTINQGIPNSSMPSFRLVSETQKLALAMYIQSLRPDWKKTEGRPVNLPPVPEKLFANQASHLEAARRGQKIFTEACLTCHGEKGLGDGPGAEGLTDAENQPIRPANLSLRTVKSGPTARDLFRDIWTGLDGTPMPSFEGVYTQEQVWDLVAYIFYLRGNHAGIYSFTDLNESAITPAKAKNKTNLESGK
jgi:mono/diheme cytochrome c family protein